MIFARANGGYLIHVLEVPSRRGPALCGHVPTTGRAYWLEGRVWDKKLGHSREAGPGDVSCQKCRKKLDKRVSP